MRKLIISLLIAAAPVMAHAEDAAGRFTAADRATFAQAFRDLDAGRTAAVEAAIAARPEGLLTSVLEAHLTLKRKPTAALADWVRAHPDLPQSQRIAELARTAGATDLPPIPASRTMRVISYTAPMAPRSAKADAAGVALAQAVKPLIEAVQALNQEERK